MSFDEYGWDEEECGNAHESFECNGNWHTCTDCRRGLGTRDYQVEPHNSYDCKICVPEIRGAGVTTADPNPFASNPAHTGTVSLKELSRAYLGTVTEPRDEGKFVTKDSGQRQEYGSGMRRDLQDGKPRFDLLLAEGIPFEEQFLTRFAGLLERGAVKYGENNWQLANSQEELSRFRASAVRHMMQWASGETDEDHMAAVAFNLMAYETTKYKLENNDGLNEAQ